MSSSSSKLAMIISSNCQMLRPSLEVQHRTCTSSSSSSSSMLPIGSYITWPATASNSTSMVLPAMDPPVATGAQTLSSWMSDRKPLKWCLRMICRARGFDVVWVWAKQQAILSTKQFRLKNIIND